MLPFESMAIYERLVSFGPTVGRTQKEFRLFRKSGIGEELTTPMCRPDLDDL
jgi:hypothetical protein